MPDVWQREQLKPEWPPVSGKKLWLKALAAQLEGVWHCVQSVE